MKKIIFDTKIVEIGKDAQSMLNNNLLILFGTDAPEILRDVCFMHNNKDLIGKISARDEVEIDDQIYTVGYVGNVACITLSTIGHCTFAFGLNKKQFLPGTIYLNEIEIPEIKLGTIIKISSGY